MKSDSEDFNLNIPPFYPGEEIICVDDSGLIIKNIRKGKEYKAAYCGPASCKCGLIVELEGVRTMNTAGSIVTEGRPGRCANCGHTYKVSHFHQFKVHRFVSKKTLTSPPMSFSKIEEKEQTAKKPQILIPN